ncbi:S-adenosylmethionine decarboxylase proenzyme precursor [Poriferisphaera corsica]|uniref:S-adenosylmethionine decarboxylase proenzyme n=1 Tax=Poriferisphaera corsica TaxID=2528020 RepID=A0A517YT45_9BACT|nr:adenosylmethionine decarboxylase [Poriferisphaera corsica]QDU33399.1 S-adenosylmethionine decarboxylase proenzyme precursor [Poriferisphaera corsica]
MVPPVGIHCILELRGCCSGLLDSEPYIRESLEQASREGMSTLLKIDSQKFEPQGVTAFAILAESHISIHTWPELGYAAIDVFTCGETARPRLACEFLARALKAESYSLHEVERGMLAAGQVTEAEMLSDETA